MFAHVVLPFQLNMSKGLTSVAYTNPINLLIEMNQSATCLESVPEHCE